MITALLVLVFSSFLFFLISLHGHRSLRVLFLVSGIFSLLLALMGIVVPLPQSGADAAMHERHAWSLAQLPLTYIWSNFKSSSAHNFPLITATFYHFLGRGLFVAVFQNLVVYALALHYSVKLIGVVWPRVPGSNLLIAFIFIAFAPMLKLNSAIHLREMYVCFFILLSSFYLVKFINSNGVLDLLYSVAALLFASVFHGGAFMYFFGLPFYLIFFSKLKLPLKLFFGVVSVAIVAVVIQNIGLGKLEALQDADDVLEALVASRQSFTEARTLYLTNLVPSSAFDIIWQAPIRIFYFLFKPFPWDVRGFGDVLAFVDAFVWVMVAVLLYRNRKVIAQNKGAMVLFFCLLAAIFTFSYGTTNYGTAIRHRTKFYVVAIVLVAPFLPRVRFGRRKVKKRVSYEH